MNAASFSPCVSHRGCGGGPTAEEIAREFLLRNPNPEIHRKKHTTTLLPEPGPKVIHGWIALPSPRQWFPVYRFKSDAQWMTIAQYNEAKRAGAKVGDFFTTKRGYGPADPARHTHAWRITSGKRRVPVIAKDGVFVPHNRAHED
ncbi:MAG: hypothetical protein V4697_02840 [Patescibacteria group bacterium]